MKILGGKCFVLWFSATLFSPLTAWACSDFAIQLPEEDTPANTRHRDVALYMIRGLSDGAFTIEKDAIHVLCERLAPEVLVSFEAMSNIDWRTLREVYQTNFIKTRGERDQLGAVPLDKVRFEELWKFRAWNRVVVPKSAVKKKTRVIYRSPVGLRPKVSVSETIDSDSGIF